MLLGNKCGQSQLSEVHKLLALLHFLQNMRTQVYNTNECWL
jgi:hypothetical protein